MIIPESGSPEKSYRPDIDGLRAIAVLSVVLFHAGVPLDTGGFTGVDIFFAISGYLIGGHIFSELRSGSFSYLRFYQRRAKRILPACYVVILFTIAATMLLLSPFEAAQLGRGAVAATLSVSNILFWKTSSYFDMASELNPLLMTWSLGVEEQFYAVIPLLMVVLFRIRQSLLLPCILVICVVSFWFAVHEVRLFPMVAFYMLPPRAWELGAGVALAVAERGAKQFALSESIGQYVSATGLALILAPIFLLTAATPFPGASALPSVLGAVMLLAGSKSWINARLLSLPPLVFVGRISYSLYLWHWPLLALGRVVYGGHLPGAAAACLIPAAFGAAVLSYYFIEQPFRKSSLAPAPLLVRYAIVSFGVVAIGAIVWLSNGVPGRYPQLAAMEISDVGPRKDPCMLPYGVSRPNLSPAYYDGSGNRPLVAIWGDSHSSALAPGLRFVSNAKGYGVVELDKSSCPPLTGATRYVPEQPTLASDCLHFNQEVLAILDKDRSIQLVVLAGYWEVPFHRNAKDGWLTADLANEHEIPTLAASSKLFEDALAATVESLQNAGKRVVVLEDVPMFELDPLWRVRTGEIPARRDLVTWLKIPDLDDPGFVAPKVSPAATATTALLRQTIAGLPNAELVDLKLALCRNANECAYRDGDELLYADAQHLSVNGAKYALRDFTLPAANSQAISSGK